MSRGLFFAPHDQKCCIHSATISFPNRAWFLQEKSDHLMTHNDLQELWVILEKSSESSHGDIDYDDFTRIANLLPPSSKARKYLTAKTFGKLTRGRTKLSIVILFNFIVRKEWFCQTKIALSLYDVSGQGFLTETDLENYIRELIPTLNELKDMEENFYPFYVCIAVRKFFFFLDPHRTSRIKINDVLYSGFLDTLLELREDDLKHISNNWFSSVNAHRLYDLYVSMDEDQNGMLSKQEVKIFTGSTGNVSQTFTDAFIDRLFEESVTYSGEIDFKVFVDLIIALENKKQAASLHYFFRILDMDRKGFLDTFNLYYFYRDIISLLKENNQDVISFEDIQTEIQDIVKPKIPEKITLEDLIACNQGDIVVTVLTDFRGFNDYESRESAVVDDSIEQKLSDEEEPSKSSSD